MAPLLPTSPSFVSLSSTHPSTVDSDSTLLTPKVRFEHECVVIPDSAPVSRLPRLVTKSYSLPLWKRKREPSIVSESEDEPSEDHVLFKVSVPSITIKARSPSRDAAHVPLVSCLVHPQPTSHTSTPERRGRPRRASLPQPMATDTVTVPLRSCCAQCYSSIDQCISAGEHWKIHFSRGALRRRKSVSDAHTPSRARHCVRDAMPGFDAIVAVDEVDRRRMSTEIDPLTAFTIAVPTTSVDTSTGPEDIPLRRALSLPDAVYPTRTNLLLDRHPRTISPPIPEEDEHRPSPRRTPVVSPRASITNLTTVRVMHVADTSDLPDLHASPPPMKKTLSEDSTLSADENLPSSPMSGLTDDDRETISAFFSSSALALHQRGCSDPPVSSPSSSPRIDHARAPAGLDPALSRKKPLMGSIFRASTSVLKGITSIGGVPMSV
ncbi:hypothetical protein DICSQDRAFT_184092 [Dichomitus squalens LYAD-421 SS1]|uniref:Uncharacterized protein n=1 Tax=Dichomitus squalens (strain LYAD-421) TaxID=732165 RepID=R7SIF2_DICSQ|nr:uncharacterized protein DICSQDRAFT_184092 [Dichomitus squalens LYAD-421 SS1]EJF55941.1 hypothetical protein DICSQDRAFT_184092 [Dichomitus squalens LYAD-421 SS1]